MYMGQVQVSNSYVIPGNVEIRDFWSMKFETFLL